MVTCIHTTSTCSLSDQCVLVVVSTCIWCCPLVIRSSGHILKSKHTSCVGKRLHWLLHVSELRICPADNHSPLWKNNHALFVYYLKMNWGHFDSAVTPLSLTWLWYLEMRLICGVLQMLGEYRAESSLCVRDGGTALTSLLNWKGKSLQAQSREERDKGGGRERREVRPLRGNVILWSSAPYTHTRTYTGMLCWCAG